MDLDAVARRMVDALIDALEAQGLLDRAWYAQPPVDRMGIQDELADLICELLEENT